MLKIRAESVKEQFSHLVDLEQLSNRENRWRLVDTSAARMVQTLEFCLLAATEGKLEGDFAATMNSDDECLFFSFCHHFPISL